MLNELLTRYPALKGMENVIKEAEDAIAECYANGGKVLICGNGGSAADSDHIVGELMKGFLLKRPVSDERIPEELRKGLQGALPAISLNTHSALSSAFLNDVDPEMIYAQMTYGYAKEGDIFIGISTSGNAKNVCNAMKVAKALGAKTIALTGEGGGKLGELADIAVRVPERETFKVQELHLPVYHYLCAAIEARFYNE